MSDERDIRAEDGDDDTAGATRPSGKRSTRRVRPSDPPADNGNGGVAMLDRPSSLRKADKAAGKTTSNPFKRILKFLREVIAELRKVIWPNRKQMVTYTAVVLVFVVFMVAFISGIDVVYVKAVDWLFG
ncbi:preprotein translocase subunit SecE [Nocardia mangyaensis]|uniref:preprotein translocase subunit SecE n=1 Tax=Nocardia mangyaensis TaxID=2213200 RepID=UPI002676D207|nr:preprotein translocase subunit SecE [Nocardia mangyaensis]MDO3650114.1 preprotein translocase subunit SecE [Nocardia mangyaensis]